MKFYQNGGMARRALAVALGMALTGAVSVTHAQATQGDVAGVATYAAGETVVLKNLDSGFTRSVDVGTDGRFRLQQLPTGRYSVQLMQGSQVVTTSELYVVAGQTVQANLVTKADAKNLAAVTVSANAIPPIDVSSVESRTTFTASQLNALPVPRDVVSVAQLTPGTVAGNSIFGNLPSFGGSSVAENSYYVNGFNVTNLYNNLSFGEVPFQAIDQLDIQTGGYGAQYGFSTGGVTSVVVKRGTNEWKGGVSWTTAPNWARENAPNIYRGNGTVYRDNSKNRRTDNVYTAWMGGPLIKDKLFIFALAQLENNSGTTYSTSSTTGTSNNYTGATAYNSVTKSPYWVVKLDWNINDNNHLEYTGFNNTDNTSYSYFSAAYQNGDVSKTNYNGQLHTKFGGQTHIFKYTSYLTDDLTLSAQYGKMDSNNSTYSKSPDGDYTTYDGNINGNATGCPYVAYAGNPWGPRGCWITSSQDVYGGKDQRKSWRVDLDWKLGDHDIGVGYSDERWSSDAGTAYSGGHYYYFAEQPGADPVADPGYVYDYQFSTGGSVKIDQKSAYVEDHWQVTDRVVLYGGIRDDNFANKNGAGDVFVKQNNIWQPRLGFSWDVLGDSSLKVFGNAGRYALPIAANVALRAATASIYTEDDYYYTGQTANGTPTGLTFDGHYVYNGENGTTPDPKAVASKDLKPYTQDEYILGVAKTLHSDIDFFDNWTVGVKATYRKLKNAIDDTCDSRPLYALAAQNGANLDDWPAGEWSVADGMAGCWIYNPGSALKLTTPLDSSSTTYNIDVPGNQLGPKAKRHYQGLAFTAEKATDKYYLNASYTWSKSYGNTEGLVKSNNGQDDTGTTADFDFPEIMHGANGYLPNDRRHSIKLYGSYKFSPEWSAGLNVLVQSGAPISCYGGGGLTEGTEFGYGGQWHYCNGKISPEGTSGRTPWVWTVSPNVIYSPEWAKGLTATLSVLNLFNNNKPLFVNEVSQNISQSGRTVTTYTNYKLPKYFNSPRYARLQVQYDFSL